MSKIETRAVAPVSEVMRLYMAAFFAWELGNVKVAADSCESAGKLLARCLARPESYIQPGDETPRIIKDVYRWPFSGPNGIRGGSRCFWRATSTTREVCSRGSTLRIWGSLLGMKIYRATLQALTPYFN